MHPVLFNLWKYPVYSWGLSLALAFVVGTLLSAKMGKKRGIDPDNIIDLALIVCIASIIGARALHVLLNLRDYVQYPSSIIQMRDGGLSFFGGLGGGVLAGVIYCRVKKINIGEMGDVVAPAVALGYAIVRIGCLLNGCCYGTYCELPWALSAGPDGMPRHPAQIYSSIYSLIIFAILMKMQPKRKFDGHILWLYVGLYSIARFIVEFWRVGVRDYFAPFTATQILCVVLGVLAFGVLRVKVAHAPNTKTGAGPSVRA